MKILLLYTYNQGYLSGFFTELAKHLSQGGHKVNCFSLKNKETIFEDQEVSYCIAKRGGYLKTYYQIYKIIKSTKPDFILSNFSYVNPALFFGRLLGIKKNVVWFHSLNEQTDATAINIFIKKMFLKLSNLIIANSELTKRQLQEAYNVPLNKLISIPFWTNIQENEKSSVLSEEMKIDANFINIGCPGRLEASKNQKVAIEAVAQLADMGHTNIRLYLAGKGRDRKFLELFCEKSGVSDKVIFLNHLSHYEMIGFYKNMDMVVLPSLHEAFGLVFIEAISLGTPVIVSSRFGALSFIDDAIDISKFTFNPESSEELAKKLIEYTQNRNLHIIDFKQLYHDYFNKGVIFKMFENVMLDKTH